MSENDVKKIFAKNIYKLRKNKNLTQKELGEELGLGKTTISQWESAQKLPNAASIEKIATFFNIPKSTLFEEGNSQYVTLNNLVNVPVIKKVSYDEKLVIDEVDSYEETPGNWLQGDNYFYIKVKDNSMAEYRIHNGDLALIKEQKDISNGTIVAVLNKDSICLKMIYFQNKTIVLQSSDPKVPPILVGDNDNIHILGEVKKVIINF